MKQRLEDVLIVDEMKKLENKSIVDMSAMVDKTSSYYESSDGDWETYVKKQFNLTDIQVEAAKNRGKQIVTKKEVLQYQDYLAFKRGKYDCKTEYNQNSGRIIQMTFDQK